MDKSNSLIMATRLRELREQKKLSHNALSKAIKDKYNIDISRDSLMSYEVADPHHTKAYKNEGMRVEYLRCLADFYGVSANYLLGISNDPAIKSYTVDELGLSKEVVEHLNHYRSQKDADSFISGINMLLTAPRIFTLAKEIDRLHANANKEIKRLTAHADSDTNDLLLTALELDKRDSDLCIEIESAIQKAFPELSGSVAVFCGRAVLETQLKDLIAMFEADIMHITGYFDCIHPIGND